MDEIGDLSPEQQVRLLRVLEQRCVDWLECNITRPLASSRAGRIRADQILPQPASTTDDMLLAVIANGRHVVPRVRNDAGITHGDYRMCCDSPVWTTYTSIYDSILCRTAIYRRMLHDLLGQSGSLPPLRDGSVVLDLGCGTGNLSREILAVRPNTTLIAIERDAAMAEVFRSKLFPEVVDAPMPGGAFLLEEDIVRALDWLADRRIVADHAFLVNVLFLLEERDLGSLEGDRSLQMSQVVNSRHTAPDPQKLGAQL